jgi:hypothetical protein
MLVGPTRASFLLAVGVVSVAAVIACSSTSNSGAASTTKTPVCPSSFGDVATATCSVEGQSCSYLAPCTTFTANAVCVCTGGSFVCGGFGDAGTACPVLTTTEMCPKSESSANGLFCTEPGLSCPYPSACAGIPAYDTCYCAGGRTADEQPHFECSSPCVPGADATAPSPDASTPPDARPSDDAQADSAPSIDGAGDP